MSLTFGKRILIYSALFSRINSESLKTEKLVSRLSRLRPRAFEKVRMVSFLILLSRSDCKIYTQDMIDSIAYPENECIRNVERYKRLGFGAQECMVVFVYLSLLLLSEVMKYGNHSELQILK